ncbi:DASS family sodium-coupled anion symporter [Deltaproteobacteria bacterium TL4]
MKKLLLSILIPLLVLLIPSDWIPLEGLTLIEHRVLAVFVLALLFWILEPIPLFATSMLIVVLQLILVSDNGLIWLRPVAEPSSPSQLIAYKSFLEPFASPIIMLFLGGFFLAKASTKYRLDVNLARVLLRPFGNRPSLILMGLMMITALFSMFMSNTACTALMLAIVTPVLALFDETDPGRSAFVLSVPFAANIGGIGTPIGTPPNAIAMKFLMGAHSVSFSQWMMFAVPFMLTLLFISWVLLLFFLPPRSKVINLKLEGVFATGWEEWVVYLTFGLTVLLWLTEDIHGINSYIVGLIPVAVFVVTGIISAKELKGMDWDVLWLIAGGFALEVGLTKSGLTSHVIKSLTFDQVSPVLVLLLITLVPFAMSTLISNTATANLFIPIGAAISATIPSLSDIGGLKGLVIAIGLTCSLAMSLPVSTPPNAMAYATNMVKSRDMLKIGGIIGILGLLLMYLMLYLLKLVHFI